MWGKRSSYGGKGGVCWRVKGPARPRVAVAVRKGERGNRRGAEQGKTYSGKTALTLEERKGLWNILIRSVKTDWGR